MNLKEKIAIAERTPKVRIYRAMNQVEVFFTRKRYFGNYPKIKSVIIKSVLMLIDAYIIGVLGLQVSPYVSMEAKTYTVSAQEARHEEKVAEQHIDTIEDIIRQHFGDKADEAIKVFTCESHLNPETIGDKNLAYLYDGKIYGRSIGLAQVRVLQGRTDNPAEYEEKLKDPRENMREAKKIYDSAGWNAWRNCSKQVGLIK